MAAVTGLCGEPSRYVVEAVYYGKRPVSFESFEDSSMYAITYKLDFLIDGPRWGMEAAEVNRYISPNIGRSIPDLTLKKAKFEYTTEDKTDFNIDESFFPENPDKRRRYLRELTGFMGAINSIKFYRERIAGIELESSEDWGLIEQAMIGSASPRPVRKIEPRYFRFYDDVNEYFMVFDESGVFCFFDFNGAHARGDAVFDLLPVLSLSYEDLDPKAYREIAHSKQLLEYDKESLSFAIFKFIEMPESEGTVKQRDGNLP